MIAPTEKRILIVGSEPGSATTLGPVAKRLPGPVKIVCSPRAEAGFRSFGLQPQVLEDAPDSARAQAQIRRIIHAWQPGAALSTLLGPPDTSYDRALCRICAAGNLRQVAVLDSWMNIEQRFDRQNGLWVNLPDIIAVPDHYVLAELISLGLPQPRLRLTSHPFFDEIQRRPPKPKDHRPQRLGFLLQPLKHLVDIGLTPPQGYTEETGVDLFCRALTGLQLPPDSLEVLFREHPRLDSAYQLPGDFNHRLSISRQGDGWEFVQTCDVVVGMSSTLLIYTFLAAIPTLVRQPGLIAQPDPNILTRYHIVPNSDTHEKLAAALAAALQQENFQSDPQTEVQRAAFSLNGNNCQNIIDLVLKDQ